MAQLYARYHGNAPHARVRRRMPAVRMTARTLTRAPALFGALALGILADALVRVQGRPGLNVALWAVAGVALIVLLLRRRGDAADREPLWMIGAALAFAITLMLRDAEVLAAFSLLAGFALLVIAAGRAATAWFARSEPGDLAFSKVRVALLTGAGPIGWGRRDAEADSGTPAWARRARTVLRGTLMALPALLLLGALLMAADPVFERIIRDILRIDIERLVEHGVFIAFVAWFTAGYLRALIVRDDQVMQRLRVPQPALSAAEVSVALWLLNALFLLFVIVQLRYLFGGADLVQVTPGLSYADYARRGFFELVAAAALVLPILLLADWAAAPESARARKVLRGTMLLLVLLLVGVIASAAYRMRLYQEAYGLTEQRLIVSMIIVWLVLVLGWLVLTVLRGRRERFLIGAFVAALGCVAALYVINPHALIARVNIERAAQGKEYDGKYLRTLSADAVPVILARMEQLPDGDRCETARSLVERWSGERPGGWRAWNASDWRARRLVAQRQPSVESPCAAIPAAVSQPPSDSQ